MGRISRTLRAVALTVVVVPTLTAQTIDFTTGTGGFSAPNPNNFIGFGVWGNTSGTGWTVSGRNRETARLLSGTYTANGGAASFSLFHSFSFQLNLSGGCFDGGVVLASLNGGAFTPITPEATGGSLGYRGPISTTNGSARPGQNAFCGFPNNQQNTFVTSTFLSNLAAGSTIQFALEGVWDNSTVNPGANWTVSSVTLAGLSPTSVVPEPSSVLLLGTGLLTLAMMAHRRRVRQR